MSSSRRIQFEGDDAAYIRFLEERIFELETALLRPSQQRDYICIAAPQTSRSQGDTTSHQRGCLAVDKHNAACSTSSEIQNCLGRVQPRADTTERLGDKQHGYNTDGTGSQRTGFRIIEYNPQLNNKFSKQRTGERARTEVETPNSQTSQQANNSLDGADGQCSRSQSEVQREFRTYLDNLPLDCWKNWVSPVDEAQRGDILRILVYASIHDLSDKAPEAVYSFSEPVDMIPILRQYGTFTKTSSGLDRKLACFRELVFVSMCAVVASKVSGDRDRVYEAMRTFRRSDTGSKHLGKLICGAKWANHAISLLSETKWASRSWEVIFAAECSIGSYARFAEFPTLTEQLLSEKITRDLSGRYTGDEFENKSTNESFPLVIPLIIERLLRNSASLEEICQCLGYNRYAVDSYRPLFDKAFDLSRDGKRPRTTAKSRPLKRPCLGRLSESGSEHDSYTLQTRTQRQSFRGDNSTDNQEEPGQSNETSSEAISLISNSSRLQSTPSSCVQADSDFSGDAGDTLTAVCPSTLGDPSSTSSFIPVVSEPSSWQSSEASPHSAVLRERPTSFLHGVQELDPVSERRLINRQEISPPLEASVSVDPKEPSRESLLKVTDLDFVGPLTSTPAQENLLDVTDLEFVRPLSSEPMQENLLHLTDLDFFGPQSSEPMQDNVLHLTDLDFVGPLSSPPAQGNFDRIDPDLVESLGSAPARANLLDVTDLEFVGPLSSEPMQENLLHLTDLDFFGPQSSEPMQDNVLHLTDLDFVGPLSSPPAQGNFDRIDPGLVESLASAPAQGNLVNTTGLDFLGRLSSVSAQANLLDMPDLNPLGPLSSAPTQPNPLEQKEAIFFKHTWRDLNCRNLINSPS